MTDSQLVEEISSEVARQVKKALEVVTEKQDDQAKLARKELAELRELAKAQFDLVKAIKAWVDEPEEEGEEEKDWFDKIMSNPHLAPHAAKIAGRLGEPGALDKILDRLTGAGKTE